MAKKKVIVATDGFLNNDHAKTAHGLIRGSEKYEVIAIIDRKHIGADGGEILDGKHRNIPVISSIEEGIEQFQGIDSLVIGVATVGGVLSDSLLKIVKKAIINRLDIVNGLHDLLSEREDIIQLATEHKVELIDIRKPRQVKDLHFWTGEIFKVDVPIVAFLAMDCAMGKRTTARLIMEQCAERGIHAEMIYTGQTGWMQGSKYGFIFDSTLNDFVAGELENAILKCYAESNPDLILLEGQSSLRNPSGPCGLEFIISGNAKQVILVHAPKKNFFDDDPLWGEIPSVESEINIIESFGSKVIALALNTNGLTQKEALEHQDNYTKSLKIPVVMPIEEGVNELIAVIKGLKS
jgi:uncharacterized NAD-dependent epimerase/dehydratase family protein